MSNSASKVKGGEGPIRFKCQQISVYGDIRIEFYNRKFDKKMFSFQFHTAAVTEELALSLKKREIDKAHKKQNSKKFKNDFRVDVFFKDKKANVLDSMASVRRTGQIDTVAICGTCKNTIFKEELAVETKNQVHHFDCLSCKNSSTFLPFFFEISCFFLQGDSCKQLLSRDGNCVLNEKKVLCGSCEEGFFPRCKCCKAKIVTPNYVKLGDLNWHGKCFSCVTCTKPLSHNPKAKAVVGLEDQLVYCKKHAPDNQKSSYVNARNSFMVQDKSVPAVEGKLEVVIQAVDNSKTFVRTGGIPFKSTAACRLKNSTQKEKNSGWRIFGCKITDNNDGTYHIVSDIIREPGQYVLSVKLKNTHIKHSPFTYSVVVEQKSQTMEHRESSENDSMTILVNEEDLSFLPRDSHLGGVVERDMKEIERASHIAKMTPVEREENEGAMIVVELDNDNEELKAHNFIDVVLGESDEEGVVEVQTKERVSTFRMNPKKVKKEDRNSFADLIFKKEEKKPEKEEKSFLKEEKKPERDVESKLLDLLSFLADEVEDPKPQKKKQLDLVNPNNNSEPEERRLTIVIRNAQKNIPPPSLLSSTSRKDSSGGIVRSPAYSKRGDLQKDVIRRRTQRTDSERERTEKIPSVGASGNSSNNPDSASNNSTSKNNSKPNKNMEIKKSPSKTPNKNASNGSNTSSFNKVPKVEEVKRTKEKKESNYQPNKVETSKERSRTEGVDTVPMVVALGNCVKCKKSVSGQNRVFRDDLYHSECFSCQVCNQILKGIFVSEGKKFFCTSCHKKMFSNECPVCSKKVIDIHISDFGHKFHVNCFNCSVCKCKLFSSGIFNQGKLFCDSHKPK